MTFANVDTEDVRQMLDRIREGIRESLVNARDLGIEYDFDTDLASGMETDMAVRFEEEWMEDGTLECSQLDEFMENNARLCMEVASASKNLEMGYEFNAFDPHGFMHDFYCFMTYQLVYWLCVTNDVVNRITREKFKMGFLEEYVISNELDKFVTVEQVTDILESLDDIIYDTKRLAEC